MLCPRIDTLAAGWLPVPSHQRDTSKRRRAPLPLPRPFQSQMTTSLQFSAPKINGSPAPGEVPAHHKSYHKVTIHSITLVSAIPVPSSPVSSASDISIAESEETNMVKWHWTVGPRKGTASRSCTGTRACRSSRKCSGVRLGAHPGTSGTSFCNIVRCGV